MKNILTYISLGVSVVCIGITGWVLFTLNSFNNVEQAEFDYPSFIGASVTTDIELPDSMLFANEVVPIHRPDIQESLRRELIVNTYLHSHTIQILKKAPSYFSVIEPILKEYGVPDDFKYLAVIESSLNPLAYSPSKAAGIWQFLEATGKELGLEVNEEVDERYNLVLSTKAAARYLKKSYERLGSWTLAAAAYNGGNGMINKQIGIQQEKNYYDLLFGEETGRYVFRILAMKQILNNPELYNYEYPEVYPIEEIETITINRDITSWAEFAKEHDITYKVLKRFNPWLRKNTLKNTKHKTYYISVPAESEKYN